MKVDNAAQLSEHTLRYLESAPLAHRRKLGQYFTPRAIREFLLRRLPKLGSGTRIIDPASGTGEFLLSARDLFPKSKLFGVELDPKLASVSRRALPYADIRRADALLIDEREKYDAVIGNPPYFEFKPDAALMERYGDVLCGRPNIFAMFVKQGLDLLKSGGYLGFVIPPSMNNGAYFAMLREYIIGQADIRHLSILDSEKLFADAQQTVMILILQKRANTGRHIFRRNGLTIFSRNPAFLEKAFRGTFSLRELGYRVKTGPVVWNQHKNRLTDSGDAAVPLIWAHNIQAQGFAFPQLKEGKPQYVRIGKHDVGPAIVVNRITGAADNVRLKCALIPEGMKFVGENHVNVVYPAKGLKPPDIRIEEIARQIRSDESMAIMREITGNTQISKTELELLLPIRPPKGSSFRESSASIGVI